MKAKRNFRRYVWKMNEGRRRAVARVLAQVTEQTRAVRMRSRRDPEKFVIVTRCTYPGKQWRGSFFDQHGPWSHFNAETIADALRSLCGERVPGIGPSWGHAGQYVVERVI